MAKYTEWLTNDSLNRITNWARLGLTNEQIAQNMGIRKSTFYEWKDKFSDFSDAIKKGREQSVEILENSMFKKANGFYEDDHYYPPDNVSLIFLLKNWDKEHYRDKPYTKLETEQLQLQNEQLRLNNEIKRRLLEEGSEADQLDKLLGALDNAVIIDAKTIS